MKDTITTHHQTCHCRHDISSHFEKTHACLCSGCACARYVNEHDPKPAPPPPEQPKPPAIWKPYW